ncbi:hypothetical protein V8G54_015401 [Vigna mungo]|uniref:Uncharacterized protein n=1 Tax=Vigna mungo TaxID=3915 RepID=A0AAQ3NJ99_VIGMU
MVKMVICKERSYKKRKEKVYYQKPFFSNSNTKSNKQTLTVQSATAIIHKYTIKLVVFYFKEKISIMLPAIRKACLESSIYKNTKHKFLADSQYTSYPTTQEQLKMIPILPPSVLKPQISSFE